MPIFQRRSVLALLLFLAMSLLMLSPAMAQRKTDSATGPRDFRSKNFLLHTDIPDEEAKELLKKLETMLALVSKYWGQPNKKIIEIFVVEDLDNWTQGQIDPRAIASLRSGGGLTIAEGVRLGNAFNMNAKAYAVTREGTPLHEAVHAYCSQTFGRTGPVWYSEGMAEMGAYWDPKDPSVNCGEVIVRYIRKSEPKTLNEIINSPETTGDSWQNYAWRWALCHLLANNENYRQRFRPLGLALLQKKNTSFERVYGSMAKEISFEYLFFLNHLERGLRVDLCSWDWKAKYTRPRRNGSLLSKIDARRGWQPSRLRVKKGEEYQVSAEGTWKLAKDGERLSAAGDDDGQGKLVGILFDDYELSEPFEIGIYGKFTAPSDGNLLLRCQDEWHELIDNSGRITVRFKRADATTPLPKPKQLTDAKK
jgi:hypothetical protein